MEWRATALSVLGACVIAALRFAAKLRWEVACGDNHRSSIRPGFHELRRSGGIAAMKNAIRKLRCQSQVLLFIRLVSILSTIPTRRMGLWLSAVHF